jgi:hypothetical protein
VPEGASDPEVLADEARQRFDGDVDEWMRKAEKLSEELRATVAKLQASTRASGDLLRIDVVANKVAELVTPIVARHVERFESSRRRFADMPLARPRPWGGFMFSLVKGYQCDGPVTSSEQRCDWNAVMKWRPLLQELMIIEGLVDRAMQIESDRNTEGLPPAIASNKRKNKLESLRQGFNARMISIRVDSIAEPTPVVEFKLGDFVRESRLKRELSLIREYEKSGGAK